MKFLSAIQSLLPFCIFAVALPPPASVLTGLFNAQAYNLSLPFIHSNLSVPGLPDPFTVHREVVGLAVTFHNYGREFSDSGWAVCTAKALAYIKEYHSDQRNMPMGTEERVYHDVVRRTFLSVQPNERMAWWMWSDTLALIRYLVGAVMDGQGYETLFDIEVDGIGEVGSGNLTMTW